MTWPITDRIRTYSSMQPWLAADGNAIQDRIVDLHRARNVVLVGAHSSYDGGGLDTWTNPTTVPSYWQSIASGYLIFTLPIVEKCILNSIKVKVYNHDGSPTIEVTAKDFNCEFDDTAGAPSMFTIETLAAAVGSNWEVVTLDNQVGVYENFPYTMNKDHVLLIFVSTSEVGDMCAGVQINIQPITPTA